MKATCIRIQFISQEDEEERNWAKRANFVTIPDTKRMKVVK